ncbi:carbamoyltransferase [Streptomyces sp. RGM 3693]|uniref:carbamoyltransferase family protein n=1 Tax=Streptomyces sp. RGM 3693 TaxID=3413284 RepID=UPI003D2DA095
MYVMGLNLGHDRSACIVKDGEIVVAVEEERLDRSKHSPGFLVHGYGGRLELSEYLTRVLPMKAINYCLEAADLSVDDLDLVVGNKSIYDNALKRMLLEFPIKDKSKLRILPAPSHHLAHAYSAYFASPFDDAAVLVVDGVGSLTEDGTGFEKHTIFDAQGHSMKRVYGDSFPKDYSEVGIGLFYSFFSSKLSFVTRYGHPTFGDFGCGGYPEAGKTMGLAPYGQHRPDWPQLLHLDAGKVNARTADLEDAWRRWLKEDGEGFDSSQRDSWDHPFAKDVARKVQEETEEALLYLARHARQITGRRRLCFTGGVALNSVANERIANESGFDEVYFFGPSGDDGVAIGSAYYGYYALAGGEKRHHVKSASLGREYGRDAIDEAVREAGGAVEARQAEVSEVARLIASHHTVGWFQTGSEIGPRALGHRSIVADPRHPEMRDYLNHVVKHRELFRPFAPSVLAERVSDWFDSDRESPFMLLVPHVRQGKENVIPAVCHVDGTARVQTVHQETNSAYHALISAFADITGVPLVLNTSYNDAGEPIVETPADAIRTFLNTEIDYLYLGNTLLSKPSRSLPDSHPSRRPVEVPK